MDNPKSSDSPKDQLADKLKSSNNILVTVSRNPSVDQLSACIGLTLLLNKLNKHAAAVFSGEVPSTLEFLEPEETLEKNTDSLRDFIIALDKSKADKLRYKVEDQVVRIFITPYKTSISQDDLEFSQGDFNVDVVIGLGVANQEDIDEAITAHGRILHDAVIATINTDIGSQLGSINWQDPAASSLSELVTELAQDMGKELLDKQTATALLTGIVAETDRFSNEKTSSETMNISAVLMAAGANQQLVATKLDEPPENEASLLNRDNPDDNPNSSSSGNKDESPSNDGQLDIDHDKEKDQDEPLDSSSSEPTDTLAMSELPTVPDDQPLAASSEDLQLPATDSAWLQPDTTVPELPTEREQDHLSAGPKLMTEPPTMGGMLTANTQPEGLDPATDPLSQKLAEDSGLLDHQAPLPSSEPAPEEANPPTPAPSPSATGNPLIANLTPPPPAWVPPSPDPLNSGTAPDDNQPVGEAEDEKQTEENPSQTLTDIESSVQSEHIGPENIGAARDEVSRALNSSPASLEPIEALNAQPLGDLHPNDQSPATTTPSTDFDPAKFGVINDPELPGSSPGLSSLPADPLISTADPATDDATGLPVAPPVPPPIPFKFGTS